MKHLKELEDKIKEAKANLKAELKKYKYLGVSYQRYNEPEDLIPLVEHEGVFFRHCNGFLGKHYIKFYSDDLDAIKAAMHENKCTVYSLTESKFR